MSIFLLGLKDILISLRRKHDYCEDCWYSCPKAEGGCCDDRAGTECNCGADKANSIIDAAIKQIDQVLNRG